jgi:hypothetical protein
MEFIIHGRTRTGELWRGAEKRSEDGGAGGCGYVHRAGVVGEENFTETGQGSQLGEGSSPRQLIDNDSGIK